MRIIDKKNKYALEDQVIAKMFRDKRFRTRVVERNHKYKELENESNKDIRKHKFGGLQYEPWET
jgi:hypothetical protein